MLVDVDVARNLVVPILAGRKKSGDGAEWDDPDELALEDLDDEDDLDEDETDPGDDDEEIDDDDLDVVDADEDDVETSLDELSEDEEADERVDGWDE